MYRKSHNSIPVSITAKGIKKSLRDTMLDLEKFNIFDSRDIIHTKSIHIRTNNVFHKIIVQENKNLKTLFICVKRYFYKNHSIVLNHYYQR